MRLILALAALLILSASGFAYAKRQEVRAYLSRLQRGPIPEPMVRQEFLKKKTPSVVIRRAPKTGTVIVSEPIPKATRSRPSGTGSNDALGALPLSMNLYVPFIPQAPLQIWDEVHEELCEEASITMLNAYERDLVPASREEMDKGLLAIVEYERSTFGYFESTDAELTAAVMRGHFSLAAKAITIDSLDDVRREIASGRPVILPTSGKALGNPNFRNGGPVYHMLVAKGYTAGRIITNDPGTRLGEDYAYENDVLWNAIADWTGGGVDATKKFMIVVR